MTAVAVSWAQPYDGDRAAQVHDNDPVAMQADWLRSRLATAVDRYYSLPRQTSA